MTGTQWYPAADKEDFSERWPGDIMPHPNVLVLHSMECEGWPTYDRGQGPGEVAPTFSFNCLAPKGHRLRQHFPANMSARALVNLPGGVETNTLNVVQVEISGTCDPEEKGKIEPFVPELPDDCMDELAALLAWLHEEWEVPLSGLPKRRWKAYPGSAGTNNGTRMGDKEWTGFSGVCGHQHVPENVHGDPGTFDIDTLLAKAASGQKGGGGQQEQTGPTKFPKVNEAYAKLGPCHARLWAAHEEFADVLRQFPNLSRVRGAIAELEAALPHIKAAGNFIEGMGD